MGQACPGGEGWTRRETSRVDKLKPTAATNRKPLTKEGTAGKTQQKETLSLLPRHVDEAVEEGIEALTLIKYLDGNDMSKDDRYDKYDKYDKYDRYGGRDRRDYKERTPPRDRSPVRGRRRDERAMDDYENTRWYDGVVREERDRQERERAGAARRSPPRSERSTPPSRTSSRSSYGSPTRSSRGRVKERLGKPTSIPFTSEETVEKTGEGREGGRGRGEKRKPRGSGAGRSVRGTGEPAKRREGAWSILRGSSLASLAEMNQAEDRPFGLRTKECQTTPSKDAAFRRRVAAPVPKEKYKRLPRGRAKLVLAIVLGDELSPAWSGRLLGKVRWAVNAALGKRAENASRSTKSGEFTDPPDIHAIYESNDRTHIRVELGNKRTQAWINKVLQDQFNLSTTPVSNLQTITWYSARLEGTDMLEQSPFLTRRIIAYANELDENDIIVGEGLRYGRRIEDDEMVIFLGLKMRARQIAQDKKNFVINFGGHGYNRIYPCEEGEPGPTDAAEAGAAETGGGEPTDEEMNEDNAENPAESEHGGDDAGLELANGPALENIVPEEDVEDDKESTPSRGSRQRACKNAKKSGAKKP
jgi:hypothetical protein